MLLGGADQCCKQGTDCLETRPCFGRAFPTVPHEISRGAIWQDLGGDPFLNRLDHFFVGHPSVRLLTEGEDLPEENSESPDVGLRREFPIQK